MQNDELQRVFNISENQNHRYNGYMLSQANEKTTGKVKKLSPKKKNHTATDMVTAAGKTVTKRKPRVKNCHNSDGFVNGFPSATNTPKPKDCNLYADSFDCDTYGGKFNNLFAANAHPAESTNDFVAKLSKNTESDLNRIRLEYDVLDHLRRGESSSAVGYSRPQSNRAGELSSKVTSLNNVLNRKISYLQLPGKSKRFDEQRDMENDFFNYVPDSTSVSPSPRPEMRYIDSRRLVEPDERKIFEPSNSNKLYLRAKRRKQGRNKWQMDSGTRHEALQRIRVGFDTQDKLQNDLFPLNAGDTGFDKSDSDSSEEYANTFQDHWFHMSEIEFDDVKRNLRLAQLYKELQRQLSQIKQSKCDLPVLTKSFMKSLVDATRKNPVDVMHCIEDDERHRTASVEPMILTKKKCGADGCKNVALPCMPTCVRHILLCEKQTLFEQCRVRDSNSFQCDRPVLNIKYHYPVCSVHSKPEFVLPDLASSGILYDDVRGANVSTLHSDVYKTDFDVSPANMALMSTPLVLSSKTEPKKRNNVNATKNHVNITRPIVIAGKKEKEKKLAEKKETKIVKNDLAKPTVVRTTKEIPPPPPPRPPQNKVVPVPRSLVPEVNQNLLRDWVNLSDNHLVDAKSLETNLPNDFVNGFDINAPIIQSHIQEMINSESSLSTDMLMGSHDLPNYIQVEEMIEEVEITDETLESGELNNQELVRSEDLNAVLKQLPPEAFNELFSDKNDSQWTETQALERVIEEMDVRKCALIDPSLLLEDIEPSYSNYANNYDASLSETVDTKFNDMTGNCSQSES